MRIAKSVTQSRYFKQKSSTYAAPTKRIPAKLKALIHELDQLEHRNARKP